MSKYAGRTLTGQELAEALSKERNVELRLFVDSVDEFVTVSKKALIESLKRRHASEPDRRYGFTVYEFDPRNRSEKEKLFIWGVSLPSHCQE